MYFSQNVLLVFPGANAKSMGELSKMFATAKRASCDSETGGTLTAKRENNGRKTESDTDNIHKIDARYKFLF